MSTAKREQPRRLPVGAEPSVDGGVHFRVWAPRRKELSLVLEGDPGGTSEYPQIRLAAEENGYFSGFVAEAGENSLYRYKCDEDDALYPDPASRFQPQGPEGPSRVIVLRLHERKILAHLQIESNLDNQAVEERKGKVIAPEASAGNGRL